MKRYPILILIALAFAMAACEKVIPIDDDGNHQLVLNGVPAADSMAFVYFGQTRFFLDSSYNQPVDGVQMTLTVNGTPYSPDSVARCKYFFPYRLCEGDSLRVDVSTPRGTASAATYVPLFPQVSHFSANYFASPSFNFYIASLRLDDHAGVDEYYRVVVTERDSGARFNEWTAEIDTVDTIVSAMFLVPYNPEITSDEVQAYIPLGGYMYSALMFTDKLIAGQSSNLQLFIIHLVDTNERGYFKHEYFIDVFGITPARWRYIASASQQSSMTSFFAEQGEAWGNVEGALGVFAGSSRRRFAFCPDTLAGAPAQSTKKKIFCQFMK